MTRKSTDFDYECRSLGLACAKAKLRLDENAPQAFKSAFLGYHGPKAFPSYFERKWQSLRLSAVKRGMVLDPKVDAAFFERITPSYCPVTLEPFENGKKSPRNPSVDRLVNEGTYAAGNIAMFSIRANRAKGSKTFEEVAAIATAGESQDGLVGIEWMRMSTLMYGAWSVAVRGGDPYLLPLATYPGLAMFSSQSQLVQLLLLRQCRDEVWPDSMNVWLDATNQAGGNSENFMRFAECLKLAIGEEEYPPTAWLHPDVFDGFVSWYNECHSTVGPLLELYRPKYQAGVDQEGMVERWRVGSRYLS